MGWRVAILGFTSVVIAAAGLGIASSSSDPEDEPAWDGMGPPPITRCADMPPVPSDAGPPGWGGDESGVVANFLWTEGSGRNEEFFDYYIRIDDPTCEMRPDIQKHFDVDATPPKFENARIVLRPGEDRAYVGYTLIDKVGQLTASLEEITAVRANGRPIKWQHQTATGGPAQIGAHGRDVVEPANDLGPYADVGDADFFDAEDLRLGETITVTFRFRAIQDVMGWDEPLPAPRAVVKVPFLVVASD